MSYVYIAVFHMTLELLLVLLIPPCFGEHWPTSDAKTKLLPHYPGFTKITNIIFDSSSKQFLYNNQADLLENVWGVGRVWPIKNIIAKVW